MNHSLPIWNSHVLGAPHKIKPKLIFFARCLGSRFLFSSFGA